MKRRLVCFILLIALCSNVRAAVLIESMSGLSTTPSDTQSLGYRFTSNAAQVVTHLGYYDVGGDGLNNSHDVGLWNVGGALLGQVTVLPTSPVNNGFHYVALTVPVALSGGSDYYLAGTTVGDDWVYQASSYTTNAAFTYVDSYYAPFPFVLTFPSTSAAGTREYFNVNLQAETSGVPEWSSMWAFGLALAGLGIALRRSSLIASAH
jgi:Domain of unknown function (DUF4082)